MVRRWESEAALAFTKHRPEAERALALPQHEFSLDVVALVGALRERGSVPEIHALLRGRDVAIAERCAGDLCGHILIVRADGFPPSTIIDERVEAFVH